MNVELLGHYGSDETHALSAWTSTSRDLTEERRVRIETMLARLAKDGHETPFEKSFLHFLVVCDVATHIHLIKHRIGVSVNAESARYKEIKDLVFYIPDDWPEDLRKRLEYHADTCAYWYHDTLRALEAKGMDRKRAKESARYFLPYATQTTMDVAFNFRSFIHFLRLRLDEHAQREVRLVATSMLDQVRALGVFTHSLKAFGYE
jgi:thymidylate synthase (FAD)